MLWAAPAHTRGGRASCGARRRSPCTGQRPAGRRTKSSSTCRSQLRTQNNKFAIAISSGAAVTGRLINRRPAPRSRELLCTDGVVERVAAHHAHALGRQRHAGTEQGLHVATKNVSPRASNCVGKSRCFGRVLLQQALLASIWWPSFVGGSSPARSLFRTFVNSFDPFFDEQSLRQSLPTIDSPASGSSARR